VNQLDRSSGHYASTPNADVEHERFPNRPDRAEERRRRLLYIELSFDEDRR
jgi:hypothetical protein